MRGVCARQGFCELLTSMVETAFTIFRRSLGNSCNQPAVKCSCVRGQRYRLEHAFVEQVVEIYTNIIVFKGERGGAGNLEPVRLVRFLYLVA